MKAILEYIMLNYTWLLGGAIIILLAIIGSYADKTNFGQGKPKEDENKKQDSMDLEGMKFTESEEPIEQITEETSEPIVQEENDESILQEQNKEQVVVPIKEEPKENFEEKFAKFDKVFDELLPKKEVVDGDLLDEIENLSLDKTQKINLTDIPDLDDVELPKIKSLDPVDEDIWKF